MFKLLENECKLRQIRNNNSTFKTLTVNKHFIVPDKKIDDKFTIDHYAGKVEYSIKGFAEKNIDSIKN